MFHSRGISFSKYSRFLAHQMVKDAFVPNENLDFNPSFLEEKDWPGVSYMPEYQNMKRLDPYVDQQTVGPLY